MTNTLKPVGDRVVVKPKPRDEMTTSGAQMLKQAATKTNWGFDVMSETYVDLLKAGIIDPAKVTRSALENAASVAGMILSTEALVTELTDQNAATAGAAAPGMYD